MSEWISIEERLPDKQGKYRVKGTVGSISREQFEEDAMFIIRANGTGYFGNGFDWKYNTHWKPLQEQQKDNL